METARLRRSSDIAAVRSSPIVVSDRRFSMRVVKNDLAIVRVTIAASRSVGTAVRRNRIRRRLREALRAELRDRSGRGLDVLLQARPAAAADAPGDLRRAVARALDAVWGR